MGLLDRSRWGRLIMQKRTVFGIIAMLLFPVGAHAAGTFATAPTPSVPSLSIEVDLERTLRKIDRDIKRAERRARREERAAQREARRDAQREAQLRRQQEQEALMQQRAREHQARAQEWERKKNLPIPPTQMHELQAGLAQVGFNPGPADGKFGSKTATAIRQFEASRSLPVTGQPTYNVLAEVNNAIRGKQNAEALGLLLGIMGSGMMSSGGSSGGAYDQRQRSADHFMDQTYGHGNVGR